MQAGSFKFDIIARDQGTQARAGDLHTHHGIAPTPTFMPVGTLGSVKAMGPDDLERVGASIVLGKHLSLDAQARG